MDISTDQWIDLALNLTGFLAAGGLLLVVGSMFRRSQGGGGQPDDGRNPGRLQNRRLGPDPGESKAGEFIDLTGRASPGRQSSETNGSPVRRSRAAVIREARKLIASGASADTVKAAVPISDGELAVLSLERK